MSIASSLREITAAIENWRTPVPRTLRPDWDAWMQQEHNNSIRPFLAVAGWVLFLLFYFLDATLYPEIAAQSLKMRLIICGTAVPLMIWLFGRPHTMLVRDVVQLLIIVISAILCMRLFFSMQGEVSSGYIMASLVYIVAICVTVMTRFRLALLATGIVGAQILAALLHIHQQPHVAVLEFSAAFIPTAGFCLYVCWVRLLNSRRTYLRHVLQDMELRRLDITNRQLHVAAETDPLTGIGNRRAFDRMLQGCIAASCRARMPAPFAILLLDIDYFKLYNDHYGHQTGDVCLQRVARCLRDSVRGNATSAFRVGGEEFAVIASGVNSEQALQGMAQRLVRAIAHMNVPHAARPDAIGYVTVSIGACLVPVGSSHASERSVFECADRYLYQSKKSGRNRFSAGIFSEESTAPASAAPTHKHTPGEQPAPAPEQVSPKEMEHGAHHASKSIIQPDTGNKVKE